jgi:hypothetical protein
MFNNKRNNKMGQNYLIHNMIVFQFELFEKIVLPPFFKMDWKINHERTSNAISRGIDGFRHLAHLGHTNRHVRRNAQDHPR